MNINKWAKEIHKNAVEHGWWEKPKPISEVIALCHAELSEALEEARADRPMEWYACELGQDIQCEPEQYYHTVHCCTGCGNRGEKPEGIAVEMIDCLIRILDWCGSEGIDVERILSTKHEYNKTRPYKHGGKKF